MDEEPTADLELNILRVLGAPGDDPGSFRVRLETTRGAIEGIFNAVEGGTGAVVFAGGAMGGVDGPADRLFARLPAVLAEAGISSLRVEYRKPNEFEECVLDILAACSFLKGLGALDVVLVGHSFGGAVVIKAAELAPIVRAVASLSPQLYGTRSVEDLRRPLLLVHGQADTVLDSEASEDIYRRALEPKQIVLFADTGHSLYPARQRLAILLREWIPARLAGLPMPSGRREWMADDEPGGETPPARA